MEEKVKILAVYSAVLESNCKKDLDVLFSFEK